MPFVPDKEWQALLAENASLKKQVAGLEARLARAQSQAISKV